MMDLTEAVDELLDVYHDRAARGQYSRAQHEFNAKRRAAITAMWPELINAIELLERVQLYGEEK